MKRSCFLSVPFTSDDFIFYVFQKKKEKEKKGKNESVLKYQSPNTPRQTDVKVFTAVLSLFLHQKKRRTMSSPDRTNNSDYSVN